MKYLLNLAPGLLGAYLIRLLVTGASVGDSIVIIGLSALYAFFLDLERKKQVPINKPFHDRLVELEEKVKIQQDQIGAFNIKSAFLGKR
jgi:hypothetical protein